MGKHFPGHQPVPAVLLAGPRGAAFLITWIRRWRHNVCLVFWQKRLTEVRVWPADSTHLKGWWFSLRPSKDAPISASSCQSEV
jgi:hypothetical protein